jgi:tellurite resistance protein TerC
MNGQGPDNIALEYYLYAKRLIKAVVGFTLLIVGIALIVLPGPAFIVIPIALAILAGEFVWARRLLAHVRAEIARFIKCEDKKEPPEEGQ